MSHALRPLAEAPAPLLRSIRLLATDIDGTMTRAGKLPPEVLQALQRLHAAGVEVVPVTGRSAGEALGLARYLPTVQRALAENGAVAVVPDAPHRLLLGHADRPRLLAVARDITDVGSPLEPAPCAAFRLADVAFERAGRTLEQLSALRVRAREAGVQLSWSSVHVHLSLHVPDKGAGLLGLLAGGRVKPGEVATVGDAPNDAGFWVPGRFGLPVGTAEVAGQSAALDSLPLWAVGHAADGWLELAEALLRARDAG
jgi:hydroxymethylpyrimidine pyrophosphatase-like HAD family hydrolase